MLLLCSIFVSLFSLTVLVVSFNTGFYKKGYLVMKRKEIIKNYIKYWFFIDLFASFPYSWAFTSGVSEDGEVDSAALRTP